MKTKLSQTKSAIARRKMRREETPKQKQLRLARRYHGLAKYNLCNTYNGLRRRFERAEVKFWAEQIKKFSK